MDLGVYRTAVSTTLKLQFENEMYFISRICLSFAINTPGVSKCGSNHDIPLIRPLEILQHFFFFVHSDISIQLTPHNVVPTYTANPIKLLSLKNCVKYFIHCVRLE